MPKLALAVLEAFEAGPWGQNYPAIAQTWRRHWDQVIPFFVFSPADTPDHLHHEYD